MKKQPEPKTKLGIATTLKAAAARTGLPMAVIKSAQAAGCKAFRANGRIDCDELMEFVAANPVTTDIADYELEKALDKRAVRMLREQEYRKREKMLLPVEDVRRAWFRNVIAAKTKLYASENTIAVELGMKLSLSPEAVAIIRETIRKHQRVAIRELHEGDLGKVECPECRKAVAL